jgi:hypothetical protein
MKKLMLVGTLLASLDAATVVHAHGSTYPPINEYLMPRDAEMELARSAAPPGISDRATIKVLTKSGYEVARDGDNGVVCMVMRGFSAPTCTPAQLRDLVYDPTVRAPICFTSPAARIAMPYYELRTKLAMEGKGPDQIAEGLQAAYIKGDLPHRDAVTFAYMGLRTSISRRDSARGDPPDGVRAVLHERDGRRQRVRQPTSTAQ